MPGDDITEYKWILVFGAIAALFAAFGIGANDVANAYATSVGSKALTIRQACALALIFEFAGAVTAGSQVAATIRKGIADSKCFEDNYMDAPLLMYGNLCVVSVVGGWLLLATWLEMPVSTTHSAVGGMIGMAIAIKGSSCVIWYQEEDSEKLWIPSGVIGIVISWFVSPILSAIIAVGLFSFVRKFILRSKNAFSRAQSFYPVLIFMAVWINVFFIISKGVAKRICPKEDGDSWLCESGTKQKDGKVKVFVALGFSAALAVGVTLLCYPAYGRIKDWIDEDFKDGKPWYAASLMGTKAGTKAGQAELKAARKAGAAEVDGSGPGLEPNAELAVTGSRSESYIEVQASSESSGGAAEAEAGAGAVAGAEAEAAVTTPRKPSFSGKLYARISHSTSVDVHETAMSDAMVEAIHHHAEKFPDEAEAVFRYIQIFTAICDSFAHGANDVANAMGPFMAIYVIYHDGEVKKKSDAGDDAYWILALGGVGIGLGLLLYGYKIIRAIGVKLSRVTPSRGFAIELGAATVIIMGSYLGLPLSTTHCQVGATTGVALLEGGKGVNTKTLAITAVGWVATLVVAGVGAGLLTAQGIYAPLAPSRQDSMEAEQCPAYAASQHSWLEVGSGGQLHLAAGYGSGSAS